MHVMSEPSNILVTNESPAPGHTVPKAAHQNSMTVVLTLPFNETLVS